MTRAERARMLIALSVGNGIILTQVIQGINRKITNQDHVCTVADRVIVLVVPVEPELSLCPPNPLEGKRVSVIFKISEGL